MKAGSESSWCTSANATNEQTMRRATPLEPIVLRRICVQRNQDNLHNPLAATSPQLGETCLFTHILCARFLASSRLPEAVCYLQKESRTSPPSGRRSCSRDVDRLRASPSHSSCRHQRATAPLFHSTSCGSWRQILCRRRRPAVRKRRDRGGGACRKTCHAK